MLGRRSHEKMLPCDPACKKIPCDGLQAVKRETGVSLPEKLPRFFLASFFFFKSVFVKSVLFTSLFFFSCRVLPYFVFVLRSAVHILRQPNLGVFRSPLTSWSAMVTGQHLLDPPFPPRHPS